MKEGGLSHFDEAGSARMVDVSHKAATVRRAVAAGSVWVAPETFRRISDRSLEKGDVLQVARLAGIMAAKRTSELIPLCHPLPISSVRVDFVLDPGASRVDVEAEVRVTGLTGVEMEALTAVSVAALTVYDMCKAVDKGIVIGDVRLLRKEGGKSGLYVRDR
ncbi:MAG: cyclic pyranopterin monophosphate synthase MoaC [Deltaproteobacteria bacterium]|nr:cyclic pyranopterin monophosphate synthase MoaC [Deltaproteobacteria bacterium]